MQRDRWLVGRLLQMHHLYRNVLKAQGAWNVCLCLVPQPVVIKCSILMCWCEPYPVYFNKGNTNNLSDKSHSSPPFQVNKLALFLNFLPTVTMVIMWPFCISQGHLQYELLYGSIHTDQCIIRPSQRHLKLSSLCKHCFLLFFAFKKNTCLWNVGFNAPKQTEYSAETKGHGECTVNTSLADPDSGALLAGIGYDNLVC